MPKLNCPQLNRIVDFEPKKSLMDNLRDQDIPVASSCGGEGICGKCRMRISTEEILQEPSELEINTLETNGGEPGERLSCQLYLNENASVETNYW